jgi:hypothetical protein
MTVGNKAVVKDLVQLMDRRPCKPVIDKIEHQYVLVQPGCEIWCRVCMIMKPIDDSILTQPVFGDQLAEITTQLKTLQKDIAAIKKVNKIG